MIWFRLFHKPRRLASVDRETVQETSTLLYKFTLKFSVEWCNCINYTLYQKDFRVCAFNDKC